MERISRRKELWENYPICPSFESRPNKAFGFGEVGVNICQLGRHLNSGNTNRCDVAATTSLIIREVPFLCSDALRPAWLYFFWGSDECRECLCLRCAPLSRTRSSVKLTLQGYQRAAGIKAIPV
jgi:hypothetical protein